MASYGQNRLKFGTDPLQTAKHIAEFGRQTSSGMEQQYCNDLESSYTKVAEAYVERIFDELKDKPLDRQLLDTFSRRVAGLGPACDLGCGPGQVARYLRNRGLEVCGVDLSPGMVAQARQLNPGIEFIQGNMLALDVAAESWGGIAAFYSIIHIPREQVVEALRELKRVLKPGGWLLLAFHIGQEIIHLEEWWGQQVSLDFLFFTPTEMESYLKTAGFNLEETIEREPYPEVEHPSRRAYIFATKPSL